MNIRHWRTAPLKAAIAATTLAVGAVACTAPAAPVPVTWKFEATNVTVNDAQDEIRLFGGCIAIPNCNDEPYVINIGARVKVGVANSASAQVISSRDHNPEDVPAGESRALSGLSGGAVSFPNVSRLNVTDLLNTNNKLEIFVIYTWVLEEDTVPVNTAANDVAAILVDALNDTVATASIPTDIDVLLDLILSNLGNAFTLLLSNIPLLGLGDDVGGGAFSIGIASRGTLATGIEAAIGNANIPAFDIPVLDLPPSIKHVNIFATGVTKNFTGQGFDQYGDGVHTYDFRSSQG